MKEILIFIILLVILSLGMHYESWMLDPISHFENLSSSGAYGLGVYHPFVFTAIAYIVLLIPRLIFRLIFRHKKREM